jgi:hypothetical protein
MKLPARRTHCHPVSGQPGFMLLILAALRRRSDN